MYVLTLKKIIYITTPLHHAKQHWYFLDHEISLLLSSCSAELSTCITVSLPNEDKIFTFKTNLIFPLLSSLQYGVSYFALTPPLVYNADNADNAKLNSPNSL